MTRNIERPTVPIAPLAISQLNCLPAVGLKARRFLELLVEDGIPHTRCGKLRIVEASVLLAHLAARPATTTAAAAPATDPADDVLAAIGRRMATP